MTLQESPVAAWSDVIRDEHSSKKLIAKTANSLTFQDPAGGKKYITVISICNEHHFESGEWKPIDRQLRIGPSAMFGSPGFDSLVAVNGAVAFNEKLWRHRTIGVGGYSPSTTSFSMIEVFPDGEIYNNSLIREQSIYTHEVSMISRGLKEQIIISELPQGVTEEYLVMRTRISSSKIPLSSNLSSLKNALVAEGIAFFDGNAYDAAGIHTPMTNMVRLLNGRRVLLSGVPMSWLSDPERVFPVTLDPTFVGQPGSSGFDAWFGDGTPDTNHGTDGKISIGTYVSGGAQWVHGWQKWDLTSIPTNSIVTSSKHENYHFDEQTGAGDATLEHYRSARTVVESQVTWNIYSTGNSWTSGGGTGAGDRIEGTSFADKTVGTSTPNGFLQVDHTASYIQDWVTGNETNNGWISKHDTYIGNNFHDYRSSDYGTAGERPKMTVGYTAGAILGFWHYF
jgi:hypothetical protein